MYFGQNKARFLRVVLGASGPVDNYTSKLHSLQIAIFSSDFLVKYQLFTWSLPLWAPVLAVDRETSRYSILLQRVSPSPWLGP